MKEDLSWSSYAIRWSEIEIDEKPLGRGTFGVVYHGRYRNTEVAVKKLHFQDEAIEKGLVPSLFLSCSLRRVISIPISEFRKETQILVSLRHPNIILFMGACFEKNHLAMVTEFMPHGSLHTVLHNQKIHLDWPQRISMLKDICCGMGKISFLCLLYFTQGKKDHIFSFFGLSFLTRCRAPNISPRPQISKYSG